MLPIPGRQPPHQEPKVKREGDYIDFEEIK